MNFVDKISEKIKEILVSCGIAIVGFCAILFLTIIMIMSSFKASPNEDKYYDD